MSSGAEPKGRGDRPRRRDDDADAPRSRPRDEEAEDRPRRPRPRDAEPEDDDDRPRRRPDGGKKKSMLPMLLLAGGLLVLVCCGGGGFGVYYAVGKVKEAAEKQKAENDAKQKQIDDELKRRTGGGDNVGGGGGAGGGVPAGWVKYESKDKEFRAYFPVEPTEENATIPGPKGLTPTMKKYTAIAPGESVAAGLVVMKFPSGAPAAQKTQTMERMATGLTGGAKADATDVTWLGQKGKEFIIREPGGPGEMVVRQVLVGNTAFVGTIGFKGARQADQVAAFFNNIEALSK